MEDYDYEISLLVKVKDYKKIIYLNLERQNLSKSLNYEEFHKQNLEVFSSTISIYNKIAHSELEMNENNDSSAIKLRENAVMCLRLTISMLSLLIRKYDIENNT